MNLEKVRPYAKSLRITAFVLAAIGLISGSIFVVSLATISGILALLSGDKHRLNGYTLAFIALGLLVSSIFSPFNHFLSLFNMVGIVVIIYLRATRADKDIIGTDQK